jgi:Cysteine-rich CPCC
VRGPGDDPSLSDEELVAARERWFAEYLHRLQTQSVAAGPEGGPYRCPCCHHLTLEERGGNEICPVCFWEDDGQDDMDADVVRGGPNGGRSLTQGRLNYRRLGACDKRFVEHVRAPRPEEL